MNLESKRPSRPLFRVGRDDDAWAVPDWAYAKEDRTFGNRFDDPMGVYRVLYVSSQRLGCFIETLARFRVHDLVGEWIDLNHVRHLSLWFRTLAQRG
jgi:hypothetical protein